MAGLRFGRGTRKGEDQQVAQAEERSRAVREIGYARTCTPTTTKTKDYIAEPWECVVCDPSGGAFTVYVRAGENGSLVEVKNITTSANVITISPHRWTVDGSATTTIAASKGSKTLRADARRKDWMLV